MSDDTDDDTDDDTEEKSRGDAEADADLIEEAKEAFHEVEEAEQDNRDRGDESLRFGRMGEQWPDEAKKAREGRPTLTVNLMPAYVRQVVNDARLNKPGIRVHPVDSFGDPETAEMLNGLIRGIEVNSDAEVAYDTAIDNAASRNIGHLRVDLEPTDDDSFDLDIKINRIANSASVYGDPTSIAADSSDWRSAFIAETLTEKEFKARYPKADKTKDWEGKNRNDEGWKADSGTRIAEWWKREEIEKAIALMSDGSILDAAELMKPIDAGGFKTTQLELLKGQGIAIQRERTAKSWKVTQRIITGAEVLKTVPWIGKYIPIVPVYGEEVWIDGKRHLFSLIHWGMDPQRIYNYGRSASIEAAALQPKAPYIGAVGQFNTDATKWQSANRDNHAFIEADLVAGAMSLPQRQMPPQPSTAWLQESRVATDDIKAAIGMHNASMGQRSNEVSGVAIDARKLEGDTSTFHFVDNLSRGIRHVGRIIVDLIPRVYDKPRMVRVLGEDRRQSRMVRVVGMPAEPAPGMQQPGIASPPPMAMPGAVPGAPPFAAVGGGNGTMPPPPPVAAAAAPPPPDPMDRIFDLAVGKYDVTVTAGPSFTTRRQDAAAQQMEMVKAFPQLAMLTGDIVAKNQDWPGADEFADRIVKAREAAAAAPQGPAAPPPVDPTVKAQMDAQATVRKAEIDAEASVKVAMIESAAKEKRDMAEVASNERVAIAKQQSEAQLAQQKTIAAAIVQQPQPATHPGGSLAV